MQSAVGEDFAHQQTYEEAWAHARAMVRSQRLVEAIPAFDRAIELDPHVGMVHFLRGMTLATLGLDQDALSSFDNAMSLGVSIVDVQRSRARSLRALDRHHEALAALDIAIEAAPGVAALHNERCCLLKTWALAGHQEALVSIDKALALDPQNPMFFYNRALVLFELGRGNEAIAALRRAVEIDPQHRKSQEFLGRALIQSGDFDEAWERYEWREKNFLAPDIPLWDGTPLAGRVLLVRHEQGIGDGLQYLRYLPVVAESGDVVLQTRTELFNIARTVPGPRCVLTYGDSLPPVDVQCSQMSLPHLLKLGSDIPSPHGYLRAEARKVRQWQERLGPKRGLRVGVAWSGNPVHENDAIRSIPLAQFARSFVPGVEYVALQNHVRDTEAHVMRETPALRCFFEEQVDLTDTAALCQAMDLVISVDTSIAHLAGALGRPLWVLVPASPDWRWMLGRADSPWYGSARIFRQKEWFDWAPVMNEVRSQQERILSS